MSKNRTTQQYNITQATDNNLLSRDTGLGDHGTPSSVALDLLVRIEAHICGVLRGRTAVRKVLQVIRTNIGAAIGVTEELDDSTCTAVCWEYGGEDEFEVV